MRKVVVGLSALLVTASLAWAVNNAPFATFGGTRTVFKTTDTAGVHVPHVNVDNGGAVTLPVTPSIASGSGVVLAPSSEALAAAVPSTAVVAAEACRVLQASATNVYKVTVAIGATSGYVMIFNATSAPVDGAVTPAWAPVYVASNGTSGWADIPFEPPLRLGTGATVCFSTTGLFTKTASATAAIYGLVK